MTSLTVLDSDRTQIVVHSPIDHRVVGVVDELSGEAVASAVGQLRTAQQEWRLIGIGERVRWLEHYRDWLLDHVDDLAGILRDETGKPSAEARLEVYGAIDMINYYGSNASKFLEEKRPAPHNLVTATKKLRTSYEPYPVVGVICPWNYPLAMAAYDAVPALIAGAAVIVKPSELTPLVTVALVEGWRAVDAPPVLACATGTGATGAAVVDNVDYVQFTGSTRTGRAIAQQAGARLIPYSLELGGKDAAIVLDDADIGNTAAGIAFGALTNGGQMCTSVERIYVDESVYDDFVARLVEVVGNLRQSGADGFDVDISTLASAAQLDIVQQQVDDAVAKGAQVLTGGKATGEGYFFEPTVLVDVDHTMACMTEETFGPLLPIMKVHDADEAVRLANDSEYGLSASVWGRNKKRANEIADRLEVGSVDVNDVQIHLACFPVAQAGWKQSGIGSRLGGAHGIQKYCRPRSVVSPAVDISLLAKLAFFPYSPLKSRMIDSAFRLLDARDIRRRLGL
jgi:betaine-aldehyde dehydrogenase